MYTKRMTVWVPHEFISQTIGTNLLKLQQSSQRYTNKNRNAKDRKFVVVNRHIYSFTSL